MEFLSHLLRLSAATVFCGGLLTACADSAPEDSGSGEASVEAAGKRLLYVGTYTKAEPHVRGGAEGIYQMAMDEQSGELQMQGVTIDAVNPSFVAVHPNGRYLYAVNEVGTDVAPAGWITAFRIDPEVPRPIQLNRHSSRGLAPCHLAVEGTGRYLLVANYADGVVSVLPIQNDGKLRPSSDSITLRGSGPHPQQKSSHPHMICLSPDNELVYVPDKGSDRIWAFRLDHQRGALIPAPAAGAEVQPGAGPRHLTVHPSGRFAYRINELDNTVNAYTRAAGSGALTELQRISTLPDHFEGKSYCADIHVSPDGRFLYGSNRGHDSIVIYAIDADSGRLTLVGHEATRGEFPRNFMISPNGNYLYVANQNSDNIVAFQRDAKSGELTLQTQYGVPTPVCLTVR